MGFTDGLARTFSNDFRPLVLARNLGMVAMDLLPPARRLFTRQAMGVNGRQPRLALGLPLAGQG
jgi:2-octaprenyl-6-methoxyphenol hydroxylase